eukprot:CAMPEP_0185308794 /NCGR_PEP_ID=MMETSP1363-20130426/21182_1 /TAXON_ID=38817 /ORGANISM="Gephyrocapsa oceanica, Strain RCC1303" /LENGTH=49 /DNA_ID=CAMNT_0027906261 /DNA_START=138 /DNA_END=287 /DNA_ORIENTATION=-
MPKSRVRGEEGGGLMRGGVVQPHMDDPGSRLEAVRAPWRLNSRDYEPCV